MVIIYYAPNHGKCIKIFVYTGKVWPKMSELERYGIWSWWLDGKSGELGQEHWFCGVSVCQISLRECENCAEGNWMTIKGLEMTFLKKQKNLGKIFMYIFFF